MSSKCIRDTVNKVKAKYQESDPYRLAAAMHIIVKKLPLGTDPNCCKGFCKRSAGNHTTDYPDPRDWARTPSSENPSDQLKVPPELLDFKFRMMKRSGVQIIDSPITSNSDFLKDIPTSGIIENY